MATNLRIALLGTGKMGSTLAQQLVDAGFELTLWNRTRARAEALGIGSVADTPRAASTHAQVVISSLTGPDAIRATYLGPEGALAGGGQRLFIEMSTAGPDILAELEPAVRRSGGQLVDAPIVGSPAVVRSRQAAILVGGEKSDVDLAGTVLRTFGEVHHAGSLGSGARLKLVANSMLADVTLAAAELQVAGERAGLAPEQVFWILERYVPSLTARRGGYLDDRHTPPLFALHDLAKDVDLAHAMFARVGATTPLIEVARSLVVADVAQLGEQDISSVIRRYRDAAPTEPHEASEEVRARA